MIGRSKVPTPTISCLCCSLTRTYSSQLCRPQSNAVMYRKGSLVYNQVAHLEESTTPSKNLNLLRKVIKAQKTAMALIWAKEWAMLPILI